MQVSPGDIVISEFRTRGPDGGYDEFVELFNRTNSSVDMSGWVINRSSSSGSTSTRYTFPPSFSIAAGQYYLITGTSYSGSVAGDVENVSISIADDGGVALLDGTTVIDAAGMTADLTYSEGDPLSPLSGTSDQSYRRKDNGCTDTNDNDDDFLLISPSDPQNSNHTPPPLRCLRITNVSSTTPDGTYLETASISVTVKFSTNVNVTGSPTLLLETGATDRTATYSSGSGSDTLTFDYTVQSGDVSDDLDYVDSNSLALNGGTIIGAVGDADLTLPDPGKAGSLGDNKNIVIDNQEAPSAVSFTRYDVTKKTSAGENSNADPLGFLVTFSEPVTNVGINDFSVNGTTSASVSSVTRVTSSVYEVTVSGWDVGNIPAGTVGLDLNGSQDIKDAVGKDLLAGEPSTDEIYTVDNVSPDLTINQAAGQADPASEPPVDFTVVFSEEIDTSTFTSDDITVSPSSIAWSIVDSGDHRVFTLSAIVIAENGPITPSINANEVKDLAGNDNTASTGVDNTVDYLDNTLPTVNINQASSQSDPTSTLPIEFAVAFSEPIIASIFTTSDITQSGTATGITWSITNSGDDQNFTLSAVAITEKGTVIPSIAANRVTDMVGNNNKASTSTDNSVTYTSPPPTATPTRTPIPPSPTPTSYPYQSVVLNEVLARPGSDWNGDGKINAYDEFIEIINRGSSSIDLLNWQLDDIAGEGADPYSLPSVTLQAGERIAIYGYTSRIPLSDGGATVRLLKSNGQVADVVTYTVIKEADRSWCRLPENGFWNPNCFPTPNEENTDEGAVDKQSLAALPYLCTVPDTVSEEIRLIECGPLGMQLYDDLFWEPNGWGRVLTVDAKYATWFR